MNHPNGELVGQAWLAAYAGIPAAQIAGSLPKVEKWLPNDQGVGFVQVRALVGAGIDIDVPERRVSVLQVDLWGTRIAQDSFRPVWGVAMDLAEQVRVATFPGVQGYGKLLDMPVPGYLPARALVASLMSEPARVEDDPSGYARMTTNLSLTWTV